MFKSGKSYVNTTVDSELLKSLKMLAVQEGVRLNHLLEEAMRDVLQKYEKKAGGSTTTSNIPIGMTRDGKKTPLSGDHSWDKRPATPLTFNPFLWM